MDSKTLPTQAKDEISRGRQRGHIVAFLLGVILSSSFFTLKKDWSPAASPPLITSNNLNEGEGSEEWMVDDQTSSIQVVSKEVKATENRFLSDVTTYCGCPKCTVKRWNTKAGEWKGNYKPTCGGRINWIQKVYPDRFPSERIACMQIAHEFPVECGTYCDPMYCNKDDLNICQVCEKSPSEREILELIYDKTNGDNWKRKYNWFSYNICDWGYNHHYYNTRKGVGCNDDGEVVELWLGGNNLVGTIPTEVALLTSLTALSLGGNNLVGTIPTEVALLTSLTELNLGGINLVGTIPTQIGRLTSLKKLFLWHNELTGRVPSQLGQLTNLDILALTDNKLSGTIPAVLCDDAPWDDWSGYCFYGPNIDCGEIACDCCYTDRNDKCPV